MTENNLRIEMTSDWHVGLGGGQAGNIDSLIRRDRSQLPFIPAKTIVGIWRDAAETVALGLDGGGENGNWHQWVNYLFGDQRNLATGPIEKPPRPAALSVRPARFPEGFQKALKEKPLLREALTFVKPGIGIDPQTGAARDDFLRFEEMARSGAAFHAEYSLDGELEPEQLAVAEAFLTASAAYIKRLGGKRRRGVGRCQVSTGQKLESALKAIGKYIKKPTTLPQPPKAELVPLSITTATASDGKWHFVELKLELKSPLLLHKRTVGNTTETLDYLPGTYLLAVLSKRLWKRNSELGDSFSAAIMSGNLIATHAYLEVEGTRGRPVPFAWFSEKLNPENYYNLLRHAPEENAPQIKGTRAGYVGSVWESPKDVKKEVTTHNTVEDESQRPSAEVGGVYSYEAIVEGTVLRSQLRVRGDLVDKSDWLSFLDGTYRVGRTCKDDYGLAEVKVEGELQEVPSKETAPGSELTVWLLSDVLLRGDRLQPTVSLEDFRQELQRQLGVELKDLEQPNNTEQETEQKSKIFARQNRLESWQTRWGLPRPSFVGLAAGTCMVYKVEGNLDPVKLAELEFAGMGDRRAEGYGQLCFNDELLMKDKTTVYSQSSSNIKDPPNSSENLDLKSAAKYARFLEKPAWKTAIDKKALELAANKNDRERILGLEIEKKDELSKSKPSLTQLGALKSVLRKLNNPKEALVTSWIKSVRKVKNRDEEWKNSLGKVEDLVTKEGTVWQYLKIPEIYSELTVTKNGKEQLKKGLWSYAVWTLVDACIRAHKRDLEDSN